MSATPGLKEEVIRVFKEYIGTDEQLVTECTTVCQTFSFEPEELLWKWEAVNFRSSATHSEISPFTLDSIKQLKVQIQRDLLRESTKRAHPTRGKAAGTVNVNRNRLAGNNVKSASAVAQAVKMEVDGDLNALTRVQFQGPRVKDRKDRAYRYMYEKISERSDALDIKIDAFADLVKEHYKTGEIGDPSVSTDEEIVVVGRITNDWETASSSKLTEMSLNIESSRMLGSGSRIPIRFDASVAIRGGPTGALAVGLFPGAIAALKGKNGGAGCFQVSEILALPPLKPSPTSHGELDTKMEDVSGEGFSMCIASGPYTPDTDLTYKPWRAFVKAINNTKPSVVILNGPFVDESHSLIKTGDFDTAPMTLFQTFFMRPLRAWLDASPGSIAILIPSVRDLITSHAVYPQSAFGPELGRDQRIQFLPNPATFSINGITFGTTTVDVLFHLRKEEFSKSGKEVESIPRFYNDEGGADPMTGLCRHLLQQRSFYPLFPVPLDSSREVNLDVSHLSGLNLSEGEYAPDILILPSKLKQFAKPVYSTIAVNPSILAKGTYCSFEVGPMSGGKLKDRVKVDFVKLES